MACARHFLKEPEACSSLYAERYLQDGEGEMGRLRSDAAPSYRRRGLSGYSFETEHEREWRTVKLEPNAKSHQSSMPQAPLERLKTTSGRKVYVPEMGRAWRPVCKLSQTRCFAASRPTSTLPGEAAE